MSPKAAVGIVTWESAAQIRRCLEAVRAQSLAPAEVVVWDNASADRSAEAAQALGVEVVRSPVNLGFAAAANELVRRTTAPFFLLLNPDCYLEPGYLAELMAAARADARIGSLSGKLLRLGTGDGPGILDSAGHVLFRNRWPLNRGEEERDRGQYDRAEEVFGVCGAAALYRRDMLEDVRVGDECFASAFFAYLEDVDLDWRARLRDWRAWYVPTAVAWHERGHKGKRRTKSPFVLRHSLKNRYLMLLRNDRLADVLRDLPAILVMEVARFCDYALTHPSALRGYLDLVPLVGGAVAARREIQRRRLASPAALRLWLRPYPFGAKLRSALTTAGRDVRDHHAR